MRIALLLLACLVATAAETAPVIAPAAPAAAPVVAAAPVYREVTLENPAAVLVLSTNRGNLISFSLKDAKAIALPPHLAAVSNPPGPGPLPVLRGFQNSGAHDWLADGTSAGLGTEDTAPWTVVRSSATEAVFAYEKAGAWRWQLDYRLDPVKAVVAVEVTITNLGAAPASIAPLLVPLNGIHQDYGPGDMAYCSVFDHVGGAAGSLTSHGMPEAGKDALTLPDSGKGVDFIGLKSRFFAVWWTPRALPATPVQAAPAAAPAAGGGPAVPAGPTLAAAAPAVAASPDAAGWSAQAIGYLGKANDHQAFIFVTFNTAEVKPGAAWSRGWSLSAASMTKAGIATLGETERSIEYTDGMYRFFKILAKGLTWILDLLASVVRDYGVAVILLTILIKALLHRTTFKQQASMLKMQKLAPEMKYIKEQYAGNQQEQAKKQMELFKKHGVNPMSGCLPMLIQIPIFFALFQAFSHSADLRGSSFLWVHDLTLPDQVWGVHLSWLPFWDHFFSINPLPIAYILASAWMSFSMKPPANADPQQEMMYKMMRWLPVVMGVIFYNMPSGLVLYFTVQAVISTLEMKYIRRKLGIDAPSKA